MHHTISVLPGPQYGYLLFCVSSTFIIYLAAVCHNLGGGAEKWTHKVAYCLAKCVNRMRQKINYVEAATLISDCTFRHNHKCSLIV